MKWVNFLSIIIAGDFYATADEARLAAVTGMQDEITDQLAELGLDAETVLLDEEQNHPFDRLRKKLEKKDSTVQKIIAMIGQVKKVFMGQGSSTKTRESTCEFALNMYGEKKIFRGTLQSTSTRMGHTVDSASQLLESICNQFLYWVRKRYEKNRLNNKRESLEEMVVKFQNQSPYTVTSKGSTQKFGEDGDFLSLDFVDAIKNDESEYIKYMVNKDDNSTYTNLYHQYQPALRDRLKGASVLKASSFKDQWGAMADLLHDLSYMQRANVRQLILDLAGNFWVPSQTAKDSSKYLTKMLAVRVNRGGNPVSKLIAKYKFKKVSDEVNLFLKSKRDTMYQLVSHWIITKINNAVYNSITLMVLNVDITDYLLHKPALRSGSKDDSISLLKYNKDTPCSLNDDKICKLLTLTWSSTLMTMRDAIQEINFSDIEFKKSKKSFYKDIGYDEWHVLVPDEYFEPIILADDPYHLADIGIPLSVAFFILLRLSSEQWYDAIKQSKSYNYNPFIAYEDRYYLSTDPLEKISRFGTFMVKFPVWGMKTQCDWVDQVKGSCKWVLDLHVLVGLMIASEGHGKDLWVVDHLFMKHAPGHFKGFDKEFSADRMKDIFDFVSELRLNTEDMYDTGADSDVEVEVQNLKHKYLAIPPYIGHLADDTQVTRL